MKPDEDMSFEEALEALESVVNELDSSNVPLEKSVELYKQGEKLKKHCEAKLKSAEMKISEITRSADGSTHSKSAEDLIKG